MQRNSRGGEKPSMLGNNGKPLAIQINGIARKDWYEISNNGGLLARRVELPTWLSEKAHQIKAEKKSLLAELSEKNIKHPKGEIGESHGHILIETKKYTKQEIPCVGVDLEIIEKLETKPPETIYFYVYYTDYRICEKWRISWNDFITDGINVKAEKGFMPQIMIPANRLANNPIN